jgi:hypothetical protein
MNEHPNLVWYAYDTTEIADPSGARHLVDGSFAFVKVLGSGVCVSGLAFPTITLDLSEGYKDNYVSIPVAIIFRLNSVTDGSGINDFRFYLSKDSALDNDNNEPKPYVQMQASGTWQPNAVLPSGAGDRMVLNNIPISPNVLSQDGKLFIHGTGDADVSQYIFLNIVVPNRQELGIFGICGSGNLEFALKYSTGDV